MLTAIYNPRQFKMRKIFQLLLVSIFTLLVGCSTGLYVKGDFESSVKELAKLQDTCVKNILKEDYQKLEGKLFLPTGGKLTDTFFSNPQKPTQEESLLIQKLVSNQAACEFLHLKWSQEYAPKSAQLTMMYSNLSSGIIKRLAEGQTTYGDALVSMKGLTFEFFKQMRILEINIDQQNQLAQNQLMKNLLIQALTADSSSDNSNLIMACGSRGANFATKSCN